MEEKKERNYANSGLVIGGGTLIGMGVGFITGNIPAYMFIGMGAGLVVTAMLQVIGKAKDE